VKEGSQLTLKHLKKVAWLNGIPSKAFNSGINLAFKVYALGDLTKQELTGISILVLRV
jgi:hypothetical protein